LNDISQVVRDDGLVKTEIWEGGGAFLKIGCLGLLKERRSTFDSEEDSISEPLG
jgi:hypothetical protein